MNRKILLRDWIIANTAGGLGALVMFVGIILQKKGFLPNPPCFFLSTTHMYCPGCGGTRALFSMFRGHIIRSICYNPAVVFGVALVVYYEITVMMTIASKKGKVYYTKSKIPIFTYIGIILVFSVMRNVLLVAFGIDVLN